jgi:crotonobetainyl-CoA:carnitine CoA-transferase CaiB-like acyl-CoA transferase
MSEVKASGGETTVQSRDFLGGLRVLEIGNELGEYCGKVMAGLGADVVRVEPPGGEGTRSYGPFYHDEPHPDRSLYFWHYNLSKRSVVLDPDAADGQRELARLLEAADIVIDSRPRGYLAARGIDYESVKVTNPGLIWARITPFGDDGPWAGYEASDLVQLALGGIVMNCGYDPDPSGFHETPPIAPQMWQAYQLAGELTVISVLGALSYRLSSGAGQYLSTSVHEVVSDNTETDTANWVFLRMKHHRQTCRNSMPLNSDLPSIALTKDGRWMLPYRTYASTNGVVVDGLHGTVQLLKDYGMQGDLEDPDGGTAPTPEHLTQLTDKLIGRLLYNRDIWRQAQEYGLPWAPIRRPEENSDDEHWKIREAFFEVHHDELGETFLYTGAKWVTEGLPWRRGPRPPLVGEHTGEVLDEWAKPSERHARVHVSERVKQPPAMSRHGKPFALSDARVLDLSWMLASAGAGRFLAAMGAEVIKVEHESRFDGMRLANVAMCPPGGRAERDNTTGELPVSEPHPNRNGFFMEINSGKLGISLNLKHPQGRKVLEDLIRDADMVVEGFSPGTMIRLGLGYEQLKALNPSIIYVQQSGLGELGTYGRARTYGPTAQALSGISDMSGLPDPFPPAGIGYSYLDWFGAYNMAQAMLAALYRRNATGEGCHIDASQGGTGLYLTGTTVLDYSVNGRNWARYGNRSPYKPAAPHGVYRTRGDDRWIAIAAFTEQHWQSLVDVLGIKAAAADARFGSLGRRLQDQDCLDALIEEATKDRDGYALMEELQSRHVPAGVCQTAEDRYETDPQLKHLEWMVELDQAEIGRWPVRSHPVKLSETPAYIGGRLGRSGPNYGEDNDYVLGEILGMSKQEIEELRQSGAL